VKTGLHKFDSHLDELLGPLGDAPRRFLTFLFLNVISWQSIVGTVLVLHARALGIGTAYVGLLNSFIYFASVLGLATKPLAERIGSKRLLITGWTLRNILVAPIVLSPWVYTRWGAHGAMILLSVTTGLFCITRALAGIAWSSWIHEIVPAGNLARFYTMETILTRLLAVAFGALTFFFLGAHPHLWQFAAIAASGVIAGLVSIRALARVPGGGPALIASNASWFSGFGVTVRDRAFMPFLGCIMISSFVFAGQGLLFTLLLRERLGLGPGPILLLTSLGSLLTIVTTVRWRRVADSHSSPATIAATTLLLTFCLAAMVPLCFGQMPWAYVLALCLLIPVAETGAYVASTRAYMLRMNPRYRHTYNAVWSAGLALGGGFSSLLVGWFVRSGAAIPFALVAMGYALVMLLASALIIRLPENGFTYRDLRTRLFEPRRPLRSIVRIWWYVLRPGHADTEGCRTQR
jgi:hypothetical protein